MHFQTLNHEDEVWKDLLKLCKQKVKEWFFVVDRASGNFVIEEEHKYVWKVYALVID